MTARGPSDDFFLNFENNINYCNEALTQCQALSHTGNSNYVQRVWNRF